MSVELEQARKLVDLDDRAKAAIAELNKVSSELTRDFKKDLKIVGFDWQCSGNSAMVMPQGSVNYRIEDISARG
jgi:hypothetical protein